MPTNSRIVNELMVHSAAPSLILPLNPFLESHWGGWVF